MMRIVLTAFLVLVSSLGLVAQMPEKMSYQAVIRGVDGAVLINTTIDMHIGIIQKDVNGPVVYQETHLPSTNENGLVSVQIGTGDIIEGDFSQIKWENGPYYMETRIDLNGGDAYTITGVTELLSVPYALYAKNAGAIDSLEGEYLLKSKIIPFQSSRGIAVGDIGNTIECTNSATLYLTANFSTMEIGDTINLEAHNGASLVVQAEVGVSLNYSTNGDAIFESNAGTVRFGLLRKIGDNAYIISGQ